MHLAAGMQAPPPDTQTPYITQVQACSAVFVLLHCPRRQVHGESEHDVPVPPLMKTALVWGLFMGVSSNLRYQVRQDGAAAAAAAAGPAVGPASHSRAA